MNAIKRLLVILVPLSLFSANDTMEMTVNTAIHSPVVPFMGIGGCEIDVLKNNSNNLSYGLGVNFDLIYDGWFGNIVHIKPEIVHTLKNPDLHSNYFFINSGLGLSYTYLYLANKQEWEEINGFGLHLDVIPSFYLGKRFSIGIGLWNSIIFHSKSRIKNRNKTILSKLGIKFGIDFLNRKIHKE